MATENWIVCLKHGDKYSAEYVNILYNMVHRHCTIPFKFACITEDPSGLNSAIHHVNLPRQQLYGWWYKPWVFSSEFPLKGTILFMDLDIVINDSIDDLWDFSPGKFCIIHDFIKTFNTQWCKFNSSVFRFESDSGMEYIWDDLIGDTTQIANYRGDQEWMDDKIFDYTFWPNDWIVSYKWQVRNRNELTYINDKLNFNSISDISSDAKILVCHGDPKPHTIADNIIVSNWC